MFSATFSDDIRRLSGQFLNDPATVEVARRNAPIELVAQLAHPVDKDRKRALLSHLVKTRNWRQVLVFTKTKHGANRLAEQLAQDGIEADAIHGNKSQPARMRALKRFKDNELHVLVATDIAARGIDIDDLPQVVNYDLPNVSEDYVHRIGRTGRAGSTGEAVSFVSGEDRPLMAAIERLIDKKIEHKVVAGFEPGSAYLSAKHEPQGRNARQQRAAPRGSGRPGRAPQANPRSRRAAPAGPKPQRRAQSQRHAAPERIAQEPHRAAARHEQQPVSAKRGPVATLLGIFGRKAA
jgi:ATP-dependent RNA helicase RhlE